jgi:hypothetical protein
MNALSLLRATTALYKRWITTFRRIVRKADTARDMSRHPGSCRRIEQHRASVLRGDRRQATKVPPSRAATRTPPLWVPVRTFTALCCPVAAGAKHRF